MWWGQDIIQIGCRQHPISKWLEFYKEIGIDEHYSESQIAEYGQYLNMIAAHAAIVGVEPTPLNVKITEPKED